MVCVGLRVDDAPATFSIRVDGKFNARFRSILARRGCFAQPGLREVLLAQWLKPPQLAAASGHRRTSIVLSASRKKPAWMGNSCGGETRSTDLWIKSRQQ